MRNLEAFTGAWNWHHVFAYVLLSDLFYSIFKRMFSCTYLNMSVYLCLYIYIYLYYILTYKLQTLFFSILVRFKNYVFSVSKNACRVCNVLITSCSWQLWCEWMFCSHGKFRAFFRIFLTSVQTYNGWLSGQHQ